MTSPDPVAVARQRRWSRLGLVAAVLVALVYVISIALYSEAGRARVDTELPMVTDGVDFSVDLVAVDTVRQQVTMRTIVVPQGSFEGPNSTFAKTLRVTSRLQTGTSLTREFPAGSMVGGSIEYTFFVDGNPTTYPFDSYMFARLDDTAPDPYVVPPIPAPLFTVEEIGPDGRPLNVPIPLGVAQPSSLSGWTEDWNFSALGNTVMLDLTVKRSGGVLAFVLVVLALMLIVGVLSSLVARSVATRRRPIEATMAGWFAALLFALVPLRTNLPGAPPIGAWIDVTVFFWVEMALLIAMSVFIGSWLRFRKSPD